MKYIDVLISHVPIMSNDEVTKMLVHWNNTQEKTPDFNICVHELVEKQAQKTPNSIALSSSEKELTYKVIYHIILRNFLDFS